jgi:hypothetical protein
LIASSDGSPPKSGGQRRRVVKRRVQRPSQPAPSSTSSDDQKNLGITLDGGPQWYFPLDSGVSYSSGFYVIPGLSWVFFRQNPYLSYAKVFGHYISNSTPVSKVGLTDLEVSTSITKLSLGLALGIGYRMPNRPYLFDADFAYGYGISGTYSIRVISQNGKQFSPLSLQNAHSVGSSFRCFYVLNEMIYAGAVFGVHFSSLKRLSLRAVSERESFSYLDIMLGLSLQAML